MKTYNDYMNEITSDMLFDGLLGYGLFSEKLPLIFTSEKFMEFCKNHPEWKFNKKYHKWINVEIIRNTNVPRRLGIPNPMAYYNLCKFLKDNWENIKRHFSKKLEHCDYIFSRTHLKKMKDSKILFKMNYQSWRLEGNPEEDLRIGAKYIVKADISSCFPSIYTHAIPWAIVGKEPAKNKAHDKKGWTNQFDIYVRYLKNNETHGLLIGPHASNLISEIILTAVDECLKEWKYVRYIDDYKCYVSTHEEAEKFITSLGKALGTYGLSINHKKTKIEKLPIGEIEAWINKMKRARLSWFSCIGNGLKNKEKGLIGYNEVKQYLTYAVENGIEDAAVINYAVKVLRNNFNMSNNAKKYLYDSMLYLAEIYPYLLKIMDEYVFGLQTETEKKRNLSMHIFEDAIRTDKFEEAYYALLFAIKYDFQLEMKTQIIEWILASGDCILMLISWLYAKKYDVKELRNSLKVKAKELCEKDFDSYWLFVYECLSENDFNNQYVSDWKKLKRNHISFIKDEWKLYRE